MMPVTMFDGPGPEINIHASLGYSEVDIAPDSPQAMYEKIISSEYFGE